MLMLPCINGLFESVFNISIFVSSYSISHSSCVFPLSSYTSFQSTVLLKILSIPETSGNIWGWWAAGRWRPRVSCVCKLWSFNANMWTCHCLTIIHGVRWIIFRGHRCFKHLVKRMKLMLLSDIQLAMWLSFWIPRLSLSSISVTVYRVKLILIFRSSQLEAEKSSNMSHPNLRQEPRECVCVLKSSVWCFPPPLRY